MTVQQLREALAAIVAWRDRVNAGHPVYGADLDALISEARTLVAPVQPVPKAEAESTERKSCPECKGDGYWLDGAGDDACSACAGTGWLSSMTPCMQCGAPAHEELPHGVGGKTE